MKYKVGDKIKIIRATNGCLGARGKIGIVTNKKSNNGLGNGREGFNVECSDGEIWRIGFESECELLDEELTAEEAIKIQAEMCRDIMCKDCAIDRLRCDLCCGCDEFRSKNPDKVLEIIKQWKKDHEKKEVEVEFVDVIRIIEDTGDIKRCVHEERIDVEFVKISTEIKRVLKDWCKDHEGEFFAVMESRCVVKE